MVGRAFSQYPVVLNTPRQPASCQSDADPTAGFRSRLSFAVDGSAAAGIGTPRPRPERVASRPLIARPVQGLRRLANGAPYVRGSRYDCHCDPETRTVVGGVDEVGY